MSRSLIIYATLFLGLAALVFHRIETEETSKAATNPTRLQTPLAQTDDDHCPGSPGSARFDVAFSPSPDATMLTRLNAAAKDAIRMGADSNARRTNPDRDASLLLVPPMLATLASREPLRDNSPQQQPAGEIDVTIATTGTITPGESTDDDARFDGSADDLLALFGDDREDKQDNRDTESGQSSDDVPSSGSEELELTAEQSALRAKVRKALDPFRTRYLNTRDHSPWEIMHTIVAWGVKTQVRKGGPSGEPITAIGWLCFNGRGHGLRLFYLSGDGIGASRGPGVQGHDGQFLSMMAQSKLQDDYPLKVGGKSFTLADLIEYEKATCRPGTELTFKLIGLSHYLGTAAEWKNDSGQKWSIERLIHEEIAQPIRGATCGGTHRLFGMCYAVNKRRKEGKPIDGEFRRAEKYTRDYRAYTFKMQNDDGSFSTEWYRGRGNRNDLDRRLKTTGHMLEWVVYSTPEDELRDPKLVKAVDYLAEILIQGKGRSWQTGPLGHALHALVLFDRRAFPSKPPAGKKPAIARGPMLISPH